MITRIVRERLTKGMCILCELLELIRYKPFLGSVVGFVRLSRKSSGSFSPL